MYEEFSEFLALSASSRNNMIEDNYKSRSYSAEKNSRNFVASGASPLRARSTYNSPSRGYSASKRNVTFATPDRNASPLRESTFSA